MSGYRKRNAFPVSDEVRRAPNFDQMGESFKRFTDACENLHEACDRGRAAMADLARRERTSKLRPLDDAVIDAIAKQMPNGLEGFLKGWGWRQFARAVERAHGIADSE